MSLKRTILSLLNSVLRPANLQIDTLTAARQEDARLTAATARGAFQQPIYPVPACFLASSHQTILDALPSYATEFEKFTALSQNTVGYQFDNGFYTSPDTEVLYTIVRTFQPQHILEIGCGNSTRITRQAIRDGNLQTKLTCLDPYPRRDVVAFADELYLEPVEASKALQLVKSLSPGDILFIDTSHIVAPANDCAYIYGVLIPQVPAGVIIHIHDIFLPYEYPEKMATGDAKTWGEQTVVAAMLQGNPPWVVLWPGHYLQRTLPDFAKHFPHLNQGLAQSLWLRRSV
jgi:hypothetical protein